MQSIWMSLREKCQSKDGPLLVNLMDKKGFTLIELLVVIAVIGMLSSIVLVALGPAREKARDARRLHDMKQTVLALQLYWDDHNENYPQESSSNGSWEHSYEDNGEFIEALYPYVKTPVDPVNTSASGQYYSYYVYSAGYQGCDFSRGEFFVLGVRDMESSGRPHPDSPGWSCPGRDWQGEFDWVIGGFEG